jgi:ABC-type multidrug transport system permease subunit
MIFQQINTQMFPEFCNQRTLYEARERPSKTYSWQVFMLANIIVEATWNSVGSLTALFESLPLTIHVS